MTPEWQATQLKKLMAPVSDTGDSEWYRIDLRAHKIADKGECYIQAVYHGSDGDIHGEKTEGGLIYGRMIEIWNKFDQSIRARRYEAHEQCSFKDTVNKGKSLRYTKKKIPTALNKWQKQQVTSLMAPELDAVGDLEWHSIELSAHKAPEDTKDRNDYYIQAVYQGSNGKRRTETEYSRLAGTSYIWDEFEEAIRAWGYKPQEKLSYGVALDADTFLTYIKKAIPRRAESDDDEVYWNHRNNEMAEMHPQQGSVTPITSFLHSIWVHIIGVSFSIIGVFVVFQTLCCVIMRKKGSKSSDKVDEKMSRVQRMWRLRAIRKMQRKCRPRTTLRRQRMSISVTMLKTQRLGTSRLILRMPRMQRSRQRIQRVYRVRQSRERRT